jgi:hypothetical protein
MMNNNEEQTNKESGEYKLYNFRIPVALIFSTKQAGYSVEEARRKAHRDTSYKFPNGGDIEVIDISMDESSYEVG